MLAGIVFLWIGIAVLCGYVASEKGRSAGAWLFVGLCFGVFALLALVAVPAGDGPRECSRCGRSRVRHHRQVDGVATYFCPPCAQLHDEGPAVPAIP